MTKLEFLNELRNRLSGLSEEDIERSLSFYSEAIEDRIEDGMSEEDAVYEMGPIDRAADAVRSDMPDKDAKQAFRTFSPGPDSVRITDAFRHISVEDKSCDIEFLVSDGGCSVECIDCGSVRHDIFVENDTLVIRAHDERRWFELIRTNRREMRVAVYIPATGYESLTVSTASGNISVPTGFEFRSCGLRSSSGDINWDSYVEEVFKLNTMSGDIRARVSGPCSFTAESLSGDIRILGVNGAAEVSVSSKSGDVSAENVDCTEFGIYSLSGDVGLANISCKTAGLRSVSGDVSANKLIAEELLSAESVSGDVRLSFCDGGTLKLKTVSGDIDAKLESGKHFSASTVSGSLRIPQSGEGGECTITTVSGNARITVK